MKIGNGPKESSLTQKGRELLSIRADALRQMLSSFELKLSKLNLKAVNEKSYQRLIELLTVQIPLFYSKYDDYLNIKLQAIEGDIQCAPECTHCCSHYITSLEASELIYLDYVLKCKEQYGAFIAKAFNRHTCFDEIAFNKPDYDEDVCLYEYHKFDLKCPFLSQNDRCLIYSIRPMSCRMFFSLSSPVLCRGENTIKPENENFIMELPEDIEVTLSQINNHFNDFDLPVHMFAGLIRVNELFGQFSGMADKYHLD